MYVFKKECLQLLIDTIVNGRAWIGEARCAAAAAHTPLQLHWLAAGGQRGTGTMWHRREGRRSRDRWPCNTDYSSSHGSAHILNSLYYPNPYPRFSPPVSKSVYWGSFISRNVKSADCYSHFEDIWLHQITVGFLNISYLIKSPLQAAHMGPHGAWSIFKTPIIMHTLTHNAHFNSGIY